MLHIFILVVIHLNTHNPHRDINKYHNSSEVDRSTKGGGTISKTLQTC
jgi:hypothetical protein